MNGRGMLPPDVWWSSVEPQPITWHQCWECYNSQTTMEGILALISPVLLKMCPKEVHSHLLKLFFVTAGSATRKCFDLSISAGLPRCVIIISYYFQTKINVDWNFSATSEAEKIGGPHTNDYSIEHIVVLPRLESCPTSTCAG